MPGVRFKRLLDLNRPEDMAELEDWRQKVTKRLNTLERGLTDGRGNLGFLQVDYFVGDAVRQAWPLSLRAAAGAKAIVGMPQFISDTYHEILPFNDAQDQIRFTFVPRDEQEITVIYPVGN